MTNNPWFFIALALALVLIGLGSYLSWRDKNTRVNPAAFGYKMGGTWLVVGFLILLIALMIYRY